jgi:predicted secreted hydrolase
MRSKGIRSWGALLCVLALALMVVSVGAEEAKHQYRQAAAGYQYSFPRDHFSHPEFQTEWWYYTGNVKSLDGHAFGFQVTFFRQAVQRTHSQDSPWQVEDFYLAHAALSDLSGGKFYHVERLNRAGPGIAGVDEKRGRIWNGNWQTIWNGERQALEAIGGEWTLHLTLDSQKRPVIHGEQGISRKGAAPGEASHYISLTRLATDGKIELNGKSYKVDGTAWMDHEFFTNQLAPEQAGWDWLSLQLSDQTELMLFRLRRKDGSIDPYSAGTYVDSEGKSRHLAAADFTLRPSGEPWVSPATHAGYPLRWQIAVPSLGLQLQTSTKLAQQEMTSTGPMSPNYWEGAIDISGTRGAENTPVSGVGYLEMTGYDKPVHFGR